MTEDLLDPPAVRPLWLFTLADLALLLIGFFVLIQATDRQSLTRGLRQGFGAPEDFPAPTPPPIPLAAAAVGFAPGSAVPQDNGALIAWAHAATRDPRVTLRVTGGSDGTPADVDPTTGSGQLLAIDRARATAALLIVRGVAPGRLAIAAAATGRRGALVTMSFTGAPSIARKTQ
ncbi:flagellar motor protein MotB [uncultured Sphingomonas sp.]|uniref:flagellar motor protein MotB n=1 Tax=uncultured Sphingomonas sp. TaxID=158754 RepID=UPI0035CB6046